MKIYWEQNPLRTRVTLDDADRWALREAMQEDRDPDVDDAWMNRLHTNLEDALLGGHCGDCTCIPCSCLKCWAEEYLGIDTAPGLTKHLAYKVDHAFRDGASLDYAITRLANYDPQPSAAWANKMDLWDAHLPRWREEARAAHDWLVQYRDEHFPTERLP